ncbi:maleylpyruvate isomerase family mycothiol-dependent enzyme [Streptosporangium longisporum]
MTTEPKDSLEDLDPFDLFDAEAARLDRYFSGLGEEGWRRPSRAEGWSVRDVLGHLAGEELYNHACLDDDIDGFTAMLRREGAGEGFDGFNAWCVERRRHLPVAEVLQEWRRENGDTRGRMRALGRDASLPTFAGPYPVGSQTFHYASEYATHADDVGAPVAPDEAAARARWRARVGVFVLAEQNAEARAELVGTGGAGDTGSAGNTGDTGSGGNGGNAVRVHAYGTSQELSLPVFVEATVGRLPEDHPMEARLRDALRCLA